MTRRCVAYFGVLAGDERGGLPVGEGPLRVEHRPLVPARAVDGPRQRCAIDAHASMT